MPDPSAHPILNIADAPLRDGGNGKKFVFKSARVAPLLGLASLGCSVLVVPPGKRAFPFHRHHVMDELFFIVSGEGEYRHGDETFAVRAGDFVSAPAGGKPHQIINTGTEDLRYLGISNLSNVDIVEYPDSQKIAAAAGIKNADFKTATFAGMGRMAPTSYYDGEDA
jgi:uncharacterized cupin superfamily protein